MSYVCLANNISNLNIISAISNPFGLTETGKIYSTVQNINHNIVILLYFTCSAVFILPSSYSKSFPVCLYTCALSLLFCHPLSASSCFAALAVKWCVDQLYHPLNTSLLLPLLWGYRFSPNCEVGLCSPSLQNNYSKSLNDTLYATFLFLWNTYWARSNLGLHQQRNCIINLWMKRQFQFLPGI